MFDISDKKITIIGAQRSGLALAELIDQKGGISRISESKSENDCPADFLTWAREHRMIGEFGGHTRGFIEGSDLLVLSPGVRIDAPPVQWAREKKISVMGEIEFAFQFCAAPVIAVTGSNGKTTVVNLIHQVINQSGKRACLCGNVGTPFSRLMMEPIQYDYVVLEISSFQLESLIGSSTGSSMPKKFSVTPFQPKIGVILNFSQNHLDRHKDLEEYFVAKKNLFLNQTKDDFAILNRQDHSAIKFSDGIRSKVCWFNDPQDSDYFQNPNYSAVVKVARLLSIAPAICEKVFKEFRGVDHRLEKVSEINRVVYINDSKATTPEATKWALNRMERPVTLICGGYDKHLDFSIIKELVRSKVRRIFAIGQTKGQISEMFNELVVVRECMTLEEAVEGARQTTPAGEVVLLSPMCASFDMFKDYEHRGQVFKEIVQQLAEQGLTREGTAKLNLS